METRLRLGFEAVRRSTLEDDADWMVYLERIECPVEGLGWQRGASSVSERPTVREGDLLTFRLVGVNPSGPQDTLVYSMEISGVPGAVLPEEVAYGEFRFEVPRAKKIIVSGYIRDPNDPAMYDGQAVVAKVIPKRPDRAAKRPPD